MSKVKIIFFGTPEIAAYALQSFCNDSRFQVCAVVSNPDKPKGREKNATPTAVKVVALKHGLPVYCYDTLKNSTILDDLKDYSADYFVVVAYGHILPADLIQLPTRMCVNLHGSLLPNYRGASPIQQALLNGDSETGVTVQAISPSLDSGDILTTRSIILDGTETFTQLYHKMTLEGTALLLNTLIDDYVKPLEHVKQDESKVSYCTKITKDAGHINPSVMSANQIYNSFRAFECWPKVYFFTGDDVIGFDSRIASGTRVICTEMKISNCVVPIGHIAVVSGELVLGCQLGSVNLVKIQFEGKKPMSLSELMSGGYIEEL